MGCSYFLQACGIVYEVVARLEMELVRSQWNVQALAVRGANGIDCIETPTLLRAVLLPCSYVHMVAGLPAS